VDTADASEYPERMKSLALLLTLTLGCSLISPHVKPTLDCTKVAFVDALPQILADIDSWAALDADAIKFGKDVLICALTSVASEKGSNEIADARAEKASAYLKARGY
jgi:hypothetical protein